MSLMTLGMMTMSLMTLGMMTLRMMTLSTKTRSIENLFVTLSINDIQTKTKLNITAQSFQFSYADCHYAECRVLIIVMVNVAMLNAVR
jgi:hypothetical protein